MSKAQARAIGQVVDALQAFVAQTSQPLFVGYSGGLDSTVLLHALVQLRVSQPSFVIHALHVHHGLQAAADAWPAFCAQHCAAWQVPFETIRVTVERNAAGQGLESAARDQRYLAFAHRIQEQGVLVTAHHQRDQAETVLMALARGAGLQGLGGMLAWRVKYLQGIELQQARPFLTVPYEALCAYAQAFELSWIEDPTNQQTDFKRNYVRHEILPKFNRAWSFSEGNIAQSAQWLQESFGLLNELAVQDIGEHVCSVYQFDLSILEGLNAARQKNVLQFWLRETLNLGVSQTILNWLKVTLQTASSDALPVLQLPSHKQLRIYKNTLYFVEERDLQQSYCYDFNEVFLKKLPPPFTAMIAPSWLTKHQVHSCWFDQNIQIRSIEPSDLKQFPGLKTWFKTAGIAPWLRPIWPVLMHLSEPVAIVGFKTQVKYQNPAH